MRGEAHLEAKGMLVSRPDTCLRVKEKTLLIFIADVLIEILCQSELPV